MPTLWCGSRESIGRCQAASTQQEFHDKRLQSTLDEAKQGKHTLLFVDAALRDECIESSQLEHAQSLMKLAALAIPGCRHKFATGFVSGESNRTTDFRCL